MNAAVNDNSDWARTYETKLLKIFIGISILVHIGVFVFQPPSWFTPTMEVEEEWVIPTEIISEVAAQQDAIANVPKKEAEELKVNENMLPQLPKDFRVDDKKVIEDKANESPNPVKDETQPSEDAKRKMIEEEEVKKQEELENVKKVALERLLKEQARLDQKFAKETQSPLDKTLKKRKEELAQRLPGSDILLAGKKLFGDTYALQLKKWLVRYYSLPEIYNLRDAKLVAVVQVVLDSQGGVKRMTLHQSSSDPVFDRLALQTVEKASPFPKPPREWVGKVITFPFDTSRRGQ